MACEFWQEVGSSLIGSVAGAGVGAWAAWLFSRGLFREEAKLRKKGEREARTIERRQHEVTLVEEWDKLMLQDMASLSSVLDELRRHQEGGPTLDVYSWPIRRLAPSAAMPLVVGPLSERFGEFCAALEAAHAATTEVVAIERKRGEFDLGEAETCLKAFLDIRLKLTELMYAELMLLNHLV
jgi:gas vesicle protein